LGRYPQIKAFLDSKISNFPKLRVVYVRGADPTLKMVSNSGETETVPIAAWNTDTLNDYLVQKLSA